MQFTKLFNSILDSTIWQEPPATKLVWITMMAMVDRNGEVHTSIPGLARRAGVSLQECESALKCFMSPDLYSRTKDNDGKRIREIDGGYEMLNHAKYRELLSAEERREYNRKKQADYRERNKSNDSSTSKEHQQSLPSVTNRYQMSAMSAHTEAEADTELESEENKETTTTTKGDVVVVNTPSFSDIESFAQSQAMMISQECIESFFDEMEALQWTYKGQPCVVKSAWQARFRKFATNWHNNRTNPRPFSK